MQSQLRNKRVRPKPILTTAGAICQQAVKVNQMRSNPFAGLKDPYEPARDATPGTEVVVRQSKGHLRAVQPKEVLSPEEMPLLLQEAASGRDRTMFTLIAGTGLREGEALALSWDDLDLKAGRLYVQRTLGFVHGLPLFLPPKTDAGIRDFALSRELVSMLRLWKIKCPPGALNLVFPDEVGTPLRKEHVLRRALYPALGRAKLRRVTVKSLRHYFASAMIAKGAVVTEVQKRLGHSSPKVRLDVYSHWFKDRDTGTADRVAAELFAKPNRDILETCGLETGAATA